MRPSRTVIVVVVFAIIDLLILGYVFLRGVPRTAEPDGAAPSTGESAKSSADSAGQDSGEASVTGPVTLTVDGTDILRTSRGSCTEGGAGVWMISDPRKPAPAELDGLTAAYAGAFRDGTWTVVGADADCTTTAWTSPDGTSWKPAEVPADLLFIGPEGLANSAGSVAPPEDCSPIGVQPATRGFSILCQGGQVMTADGAVDPQYSSAVAGPEGATSFLQLGATSFAFLSAEPDCDAAYVEVSGTEQSGYECVTTGKAPLGLMRVDDRLLAQIGYEIWERSGRSWKQL